MKVKEISLQLPTFARFNALSPVSSFVDRITAVIDDSKRIMFTFLSKVKDRQEKRNDAFGGGRSTDRKFNLSNKNMGKYVKVLLVLVILIGVVYAGSRLLNNSGSAVLSDSDKVTVEKAKKSQEINKEFSFPLNDDSGEKIGDVRYMIEKAELMDEIIVKGQKATAVKGRTFLILTLKITNEYKQAIEMNSKDYLRLSVNGNREEWLAPDIHNDPVEIQAISTKYTRVGFPINDKDKDLILRIGEIDGEKEEIPLELN